MKQAITHELLFVTSRHFPDKHICKKNCSKEGHTCPLRLLRYVSRAKNLLALLGDPSGHAIKVNPAKNFIELNSGEPFDPIENDKAINPYSFFPLKNFN
jgi:hypothetical protein